MPRQKAAFKSLRKDIKRALRNSKAKSDVEALAKRARQAIAGKDAPKSKEWFAKMVKAVDKAVAKGIFKKNTAARKKSRLAKLVNKIAK